MSSGRLLVRRQVGRWKPWAHRGTRGSDSRRLRQFTTPDPVTQRPAGPDDYLGPTTDTLELLGVGEGDLSRSRGRQDVGV